jgi:presqualene diphosphate synthase
LSAELSPHTAGATIGASATERADIARQVRDASSSFYWAMRLLARPRREAIFAVYAFCRAVDDVADSDQPAARKKALMAEWRGEVDALFAKPVDGEPKKPIARALIGPTQAFGLARGDFLAVIDGMEMDVNGPIVAPSRTVLDLYCDRVACAVGRLCVPIFGERGEIGTAVADHLGRALQLTNILRDVAEDADDGRLYLPRELLEAHGVPVTDPAAALAHPGFVPAWRALARDAQAQFAAAEKVIARCDRRKVRPARIMMEVYRRNLERMQALSDAALADRTVSKRLVGRVEKLGVALRYGLV